MALNPNKEHKQLNYDHSKAVFSHCIYLRSVTLFSMQQFPDMCDDHILNQDFLPLNDNAVAGI